MKNERVTITSWKLDLYRILHVFNVRSVASAWAKLTARFQTDLAINTNVVDSKIRNDIVKPDATKTDTMKPGVTKTDTAFPATHRALVGSRKGTISKRRQVSVTCTLFITGPMLTAP